MILKLLTHYHFYNRDKPLSKTFKDEVYSTNSQGLSFHPPPKKEKNQIKYI